jgi:hypothetical protein
MTAGPRPGGTSRASPCSASGSRWPSRTPAWRSPRGAARSSRQEARWTPLPEAGTGHRAGHEVRIECFDISHTQGESTVASCVVHQGGGMRAAKYRRFNIADIQPGDDCAAIRQAVQRRYEKLSAGEGVTADPGPDRRRQRAGRRGAAALEELGLSHLPLLGVAKGEARKPGLETLIFADGRKPLQLPPEHPALHLIQEDSRRGAPLRRRRAPRATRQGRQEFASGRDQWYRTEATQGPDRPFWRPAGNHGCRG